MRFALLLFGVIFIWSAEAGTLLAQSTDWPSAGQFVRGPGIYLSIGKILSCWLVFAAWVYTTDWVSQDCLKHRLNYALWNGVVFFTFLGAFVLVWLLPWFWLSLFLLLVAYIAPLTVFILQRNKQVEYQNKVLTKPHLRRWFAARAALIGIKMATGPVGADEMGPDIKFKATAAANERDNNVNLMNARQNPGYQPARKLVAEALDRRADGILLDYGAQLVTVRHQIDGVWHDQPALDRALAGDPLLAVLKTIAALNPNDRRSKQAGGMEIETSKAKFQGKFTSQGTQGGERAVLVLEGKKVPFESLEALGMRQKMAEQVIELLSHRQGFIIVSALPSGGLSTTFDVVLNTADRFTRNFAAVEDVASKEREILNLSVTTFNKAAGETPATVLPKLVRSYPDVIVVRDLFDLPTVELLVKQVTDENRLMLTTLRAKEAVETLLRILMLKVPPADFAKAATAVLNVRLVRKLCEECKEAYPPPPEVLKQMGLPPGRIEAFYRPPTKPIDPKHPDKVCEACSGIGYFGRTGIFELLVVDETLRQALALTPKIEVLREVARRAKHRTLQDEGLLLVARGITSLQELLRVLKQ